MRCYPLSERDVYSLPYRLLCGKSMFFAQGTSGCAEIVNYLSKSNLPGFIPLIQQNQSNVSPETGDIGHSDSMRTSPY